MATTIVGPFSDLSPGLPGGNRVAYDVAATGVIKASTGLVCTVSCGATGGTLTLNDSLTVGGAAITNQIWSGTLTAGQVVNLNNWPFGSGLVVSATTAVVAIAFS